MICSLVTFGIDKDMNLVIQFPVFIQPYTQKTFDSIPIGDGSSSDSRQEYQGSVIHAFASQKALYCLNSETYISLRQQELRSCKKIGYGFYCEELFVC